MEFETELAGDATQDALRVQAIQPYARELETDAQAVDPHRPVGVEHDLDDLWLLKEFEQRRQRVPQVGDAPSSTDVLRLLQSS